MFDKDGNDTVDINEFGHLFNYVNAWIGTFQKFDSNKSSSIDGRELQQGESWRNRGVFLYSGLMLCSVLLYLALDRGAYKTPFPKNIHDS